MIRKPAFLFESSASLSRNDAVGSPAFDRATLVILRAPEFHKLHGEAVKKTKTELAAAKTHLAEITSTST